MKKAFSKLIFIILTIAGCANMATAYSEKTTSAAASGVLASGSVANGAAKKAGDEFRAAWVCSVLNLDFPSAKGLGADELKSEVDEIIKNAVEIGLNALIVQVRPCGDALYRSDIFPWSAFLTGAQGKAPDGGFDPLAYWIERAHANGLELHAWVNPYRLSHSSENITNIGALSEGNPARSDPSRVVAYNDALYYDPGVPANIKLVIRGVSEIIGKYDVDGIHLDDYFYPGKDFPDEATYLKYGNGADKADWRRANVNAVIRGIRRAVARQNAVNAASAANKVGATSTANKTGAASAANKADAASATNIAGAASAANKTGAARRIKFGVSPFAIWRNLSSSPLGSDTKGNEAYSAMYADTRRWVKSGWLDYICPQIYWYQGFEIADYNKILSWWADVCDGTGVDLYVGHAAYREAENGPEAGADRDAHWDGEILRQLKYNAAKYPDRVKGSVFFRYGSLTGDLGRRIAGYYQAK